MPPARAATWAPPKDAPTWPAMPAPVEPAAGRRLKRQLLGELAERAQLDAHDLTDLWKQAHARDAARRPVGAVPAAPSWDSPRRTQAGLRQATADTPPIPAHAKRRLEGKPLGKKDDSPWPPQPRLPAAPQRDASTMQRDCCCRTWIFWNTWAMKIMPCCVPSRTAWAAVCLAGRPVPHPGRPALGRAARKPERPRLRDFGTEGDDRIPRPDRGRPAGTAPGTARPGLIAC